MADDSSDWFVQQLTNSGYQGNQPPGVNQQGITQGMQQVATAPDGVPVFSIGGKYYTRNPDGSMAEQFQGEKPDWLTQATGGGQQGQGGGQGPGPYTGNPNDRGAIANWFKQMGSMPGADPSLAQNPDYWAGRAIETGGLRSDNSQYWQDASVGPKAFFNNPGRESGQGTLGNPGSYQAPAAFAGQTDYSPQAITQPGNVQAQQVQGSNIQGPQALQATTLANPQGFQGVSQEELQNNPQFQYAQQQAMQQLVNSGAAKGVARGSNAWKALEQQASDLAGQQYQQVYNNKFGEYQAGVQNTLNYGNANNQNAAQAYGLTNQYQQNAALANQSNALQAQGMNQSANLNAGQFNAGMNYNTQAANEANRFSASQANNANRLNAYQTNANTGLNAYQANVQAGLGYGNLALNQQGQNYNQGYNTWQANQGANQQAWNNNYSLAQLGLYANGQVGQAGSNYGNQAGGLYTGIGNAQAAGSMANGQNWGGTLGQAGNYGTQMWALGQLNSGGYNGGGTASQPGGWEAPAGTPTPTMDPQRWQVNPVPYSG